MAAAACVVCMPCGAVQRQVERRLQLPAFLLGMRRALPCRRNTWLAALCCRIEETVKVVQERLPSSQILLLGLLPAGIWGLPGQANYRWPSPYKRAVATVNTQLRCGWGQ